MEKLFRSCQICNGSDVEALHRQSFILPSDSPLSTEYEIVSCRQCGFVYANTNANQSAYNTYYALLSKYEDLKISSGSGVGQYDNQRLEMTASVIHKLLPDLTSSILDMGCANGGLLNSLKHFGYTDILGIDPSKSCNSHVKNLGIKCVEGDIFSRSFAMLPNTFDCIILSHVLEHIYNLSSAIDILASKLNDSGLFYIEVPDASHYSDHYIVPYYFVDCEHINHFDKTSLNNLFTRRGFKQIESRNFLFKVNEKNSYPAVYSVFIKEKQDSIQEFVFSDDSKKSFLDFISQSKADNKNDIIIQRLVDSQQPILIWGAGQFTLRLLANSDLRRCNITGFIDSDSNKHGRHILKYQIYPPDFLKDKNIEIVICSALHHDEIQKSILHLTNKASVSILK